VGRAAGAGLPAGRYPSFSYKISPFTPSRSNALPKFPAEIVPIWKTLKTELKILAFFFSRGLDFLKPNIYIIQV
jgi:hypothetical protein